MALVPTATLIDRVRRRSDMTFDGPDGFCTDAEITTYLEHAFRKFYNRLVAARDDQLLRSADQTTLTIVGGDVSMPDDFFKLVLVRVATIGGTDWRHLTRRSPQVEFPNTTGRPTQYIPISAGNGPIVILVPTPDVAYQVQVVYVTNFAPTGNKYPDVAGITDYMVIDAAIQCLDKEQSPTSVLRSERDAMLEAIANTITPMDDGQPTTVVRQPMLGYGDFYDEEFFG